MSSKFSPPVKHRVFNKGLGDGGSNLKKIIKDLLKKYNVRPSKALGQNFLISRTALKQILETADLRLDDVVLEIGPGIGTLTKELAKQAKKVIAVEKDKKMVKILEETLEDSENVKIIQEDILQISNFKFLISNSYKVVANLPYYITSPVIRKFLEAKNPPKEMVLMVQKEVAKRIIAQPPKMNLLAISVQFYAEPEIVSYVSKRCFWPSPKVDSAIVKIIPRKSALISASFCKRFFRIARAGFAQSRKQLVNSLSAGLQLTKGKTKAWLGKNKISPQRRAQTLTLQDWIKLTKTYTID